MDEVCKKLNQHLSTCVELEGSMDEDGKFTGDMVAESENDACDFLETLGLLGGYDGHFDNVVEKDGEVRVEVSFKIDAVLEAIVPNFVVCDNCERRVFLPENFAGARVYCVCGSGVAVPAANK